MGSSRWVARLLAPAHPGVGWGGAPRSEYRLVGYHLEAACVALRSQACVRQTGMWVPGAPREKSSISPCQPRTTPSRESTRHAVSRLVAFVLAACRRVCFKQMTREEKVVDKKIKGQNENKIRWEEGQLTSSEKGNKLEKTAKMPGQEENSSFATGQLAHPRGNDQEGCSQTRPARRARGRAKMCGPTRGCRWAGLLRE